MKLPRLYLMFMLTIFVDERKLCDAHDVANIEN